MLGLGAVVVPGLVDRAYDWGSCDPSSIPLGEKKENKRKEAGVGPYLKKTIFGLIFATHSFRLKFHHKNSGNAKIRTQDSRV